LQIYSLSFTFIFASFKVMPYGNGFEKAPRWTTDPTLCWIPSLFCAGGPQHQTQPIVSTLFSDIVPTRGKLQTMIARRKRNFQKGHPCMLDEVFRMLIGGPSKLRKRSI